MIPDQLGGTVRTPHGPPSIEAFAQAAGLPPESTTNDQALLCAYCVLDGKTELVETITIYHGTSVCAQHLASMVDLEA